MATTKVFQDDDSQLLQIPKEMFTDTMHIVTPKDFAPVKQKRASRPVSLEEMTREEFDAKMERGLDQAKVGEGVPADEFFDAQEDRY